MNEVFEKQLLIAPSLTDVSGRLGMADAFAVFMDLASEHAELLGIGLQAMAARDLFWLTVKTQVRFIRRPAMMQTVCARTWPEAPMQTRCCRSYELGSPDGVLVSGKTEWAVLNVRTGKVVPLQDVYPEHLTFERPSACPGEFARVSEQAASAESLGTYTVRSTDIDVGGHMNNAAFVRALIGAFSNDRLRVLRPKQLDVIFRLPCYEGDLLDIRCAERADGLELAVTREEAPVLFAKLT